MPKRRGINISKFLSLENVESTQQFYHDQRLFQLQPLSKKNLRREWKKNFQKLGENRSQIGCLTHPD